MTLRTHTVLSVVACLTIGGCTEPSEVEVRLDSVLLESVASTADGQRAHFSGRLVLISRGTPSAAPSELWLVELETEPKVTFSKPQSELETADASFPVTLYPQNNIAVSLSFSLTYASIDWCTVDPFSITAIVYDEYADTVWAGTTPGFVPIADGICVQ